MTNLPIKPLQTLVQQQNSEKSGLSGDKESSADAKAVSGANDAITISVTSTKPRNPSQNENFTGLDNLVRGIFSDKDALGAHDKLDVSRVTDLLKDSE